MIINSSTELMRNQKHAVVMAPDKQFEVLQTQKGNALFFSIGTDGVFYLTREIPIDTHGWSRIDLSSTLSALNNNAKITAKLFDVAQDLPNNSTDIALVVTINGVDSLYMSTGNSNTDDDWDYVAANGIKWGDPVAFDGGNDDAATLNVADINFCQSGQLEYLQADIIQGGSNTGDYINRYFIDPGQLQQTGQYWNPIDLPYTISAGDIHNEVGYLYVEGAPGTYTLSGLKTLNSTEMELMFWPFWNAFGDTDPMHISFTLPDNTTAMAPSQAIGSGDVDTPDDTDLFVAAGSSLYFVSHKVETIGDVASGLICTHINLAGVVSLHVNNTPSKTVAWGLNENGDVFYMSCITGNEGIASAWSVPILILSGIENVASFTNGLQNNNIIFAQTTGDDSVLIQLTQDAATSRWVQRSINLPSTDYRDYVQTYTFTTQVLLTDDNNVPLNGQTVSITSSDACSVYINNEYHVLFADPNTSLQITSDESGYINIQQSIDTLAGTFFYITDGTQTANVNPMDNVLTNLKSLSGTKGPDLGVTVTDEWGKGTSLVKNASVQDKSSVAQYIANFIALQDTLPPDGKQAGDDPAASTRNLQSAVPSIFGIYHKNGRAQYYSSVEEAQRLGLVLHGNRLVTSNTVLVGDGDGLEILAGDGWRWLNSKIGEIETYYTDLWNGLTHLFFEIAGQLYHFAIRAIHDIAAGIDFVLNKIAVAFEDMVKWLGSIFAWTDILRTHKVLRSMFRNYGNYCIANIGTAQAQINNAVSEAVSAIDSWAGLANNTTLPTDSYSSQSGNISNDNGQHSSSSHWGHQHTKNNVTNSGFSSAGTELGTLLNDFFTALEVEADIITIAVDQIKDIISEIGSLSLEDLLKKIVAVIADAVLESVANVADAFLSAAETIVLGIIETIYDNPIQIPVLSPLYKFFTNGDELTLLDLVCLITAIPVNVIYKIANNQQQPFPDNSNTTALQSAQSFNDFIQAAAKIETTTSAGRMPGASEVWTDAVNTHWTKIGNICALAGSVSISFFAVLKSKLTTGYPGYIAAVGYGICYFPYVAPDAIGVVQDFYNPGKNWYNIMNAGLATLGVIKSFVDVCLVKPAINPDNIPVPPVDPPVPPVNPPVDPPVDPPPPPVPPPALPADPGATSGWTKPFKNGLSWNDASPFFEAGINLAWEVPVVAAYLDGDKGTNQILECTGNTLFNFGGVISFGSTFGPPPVPLITLIAQVVCNLGYGAMLFATSFDKSSNN